MKTVFQSPYNVILVDFSFGSAGLFLSFCRAAQCKGWVVWKCWALLAAVADWACHYLGYVLGWISPLNLWLLFSCFFFPPERANIWIYICLQVVWGCRSLWCPVCDMWAIEKTTTEKLQQTHDDVAIQAWGL